MITGWLGQWHSGTTLGGRKLGRRFWSWTTTGVSARRCAAGFRFLPRSVPKRPCGWVDLARDGHACGSGSFVCPAQQAGSSGPAGLGRRAPAPQTSIGNRHRPAEAGTEGRTDGLPSRRPDQGREPGEPTVPGTGPLPVDGSATGNPRVVTAAGRLPGRYQLAGAPDGRFPGRPVDSREGAGTRNREAGRSVLFRHPERDSARPFRNGHRGARNVPPGARNSDVEQSKRSGTVAGTTGGSGSGPRNDLQAYRAVVRHDQRPALCGPMLRH